MSVKKLSAKAFNKWVDVCVQEHCVYGVQAKNDRFAFGPLARGVDLRLDYDVTILPPKKYLQPPSEALLKFNKEAEYESITEVEPFVIFGIHPYDIVAISQMDKVFSADNGDIHYMKRREQATLVAVDVQNASDNVFAGSMGTAVVDEGFDILLTRLKDSYLIDIRTEKGEALMKHTKKAEDATEADLKLRQQVQEDNKALLNKHELLTAPQELPALLNQSLDHPVWKEKAELCYSCGSCNLVCPTCYCFDVEDDVDWSLDEGVRRRKWDGCMLAEFAAVAGGHNFRRHREDRYRHRYYRKGRYIHERYGDIACVGCGRCITACTANIANPVEIYNRLREDH
ncbi:MAG: 4Fe-4S dicluster domain-containing protein [Sedimentisphaerales bacterium]|nr:4Fe-4S dicluster domain-containing protein [Sedimentisphaerales bacterium]